MLQTQQQQVPATSRWSRFIGLNWYDHVLDFLFRLTAKSSEVLLAVGVILSTANHFQHGALFDHSSPLFKTWTWTQAIGFEASAGVVLAMALDANRDNDKVKRNLLLALMTGLALVGTVMLVMAFVEAATGIQESGLPAWYGITMAIVRGLVSVAYVTIGRVKNRRFSGSEPQVVQRQEMQRYVDEYREQFTAQMQAVQADVQHRIQQVQRQVQQLLPDVQSVIEEQHQQVQRQVHLTVQEVVQEQTQAQVQSLVHCLEEVQASTIEQLSEQVVATVQAFKQEMQTTITEVRTVRRTAIAERSAQQQSGSHLGSVESSPVQEDEPSNIPALIPGEPLEPANVRVPRFIQQQVEQGRTPTLTEIMTACKVAKNTAIRYRRERLGEEGIV